MNEKFVRLNELDFDYCDIVDDYVVNAVGVVKNSRTNRVLKSRLDSTYSMKFDVKTKTGMRTTVNTEKLNEIIWNSKYKFD